VTSKRSTRISRCSPRPQRKRALLNFAPIQLQVPPDVTLKNVNMAMELEGLSFALTNRDR
jgi:NADH/NAD ratio-sensing transcriptional regulator Rex